MGNFNDVAVASTTCRDVEEFDCYHRLESKINILIIEDNLVMQKLYKHMLRNLGYNCGIASNGCEALKMFNTDYSMLFVDINLLDICGVEVIKKIRQLVYGSVVPIVAVTAFSSKEIIEQCRTAGVNNVVIKPICQEKIRCLVDHYICNNLN